MCSNLVTGKFFVESNAPRDLGGLRLRGQDFGDTVTRDLFAVADLFVLGRMQLQLSGCLLKIMRLYRPNYIVYTAYWASVCLSVSFCLLVNKFVRSALHGMDVDSVKLCSGWVGAGEAG